MTIAKGEGRSAVAADDSLMPPQLAPEPIAILQIVPELDTGGAERTTVDITRALCANGFRALVVSEGGWLDGELISSGGELIRMPVASKNPLRILANAAAIARIILRRNVAVIHARSRAPAWSALIAARRTRIPFVTTYHGIYTSRLPFKRWYNSVMARGDRVIANSEWTAHHILSTYRIDPERLVVIPRGIDLREFNPARVDPERVRAIRFFWAAKEDTRLILLPGRLARWKGQLIFVRALEHLKKNGVLPQNIRAVIAGSTQGREAYLREIIQAIAHAGLRDTLMVADHVTEMPAAYLAADIVVSASTEPEAFGRVAPEAAAMGRTVVATDHGGARETILPGKSGLLVEPGSETALAEALLALLMLSPSELAAMGAAGRAHVEEHYQLERMCTDTLNVYRDLLADVHTKKHKGSGTQPHLG